MSESADRSIGRTLRDRRLELGVDLEEIVARTRIRRAYLEALEEDRFEAFPGAAYLKGYIRGYAEALELDPQPLLQAYARLSPPAAAPAPLELAALPEVAGSPARPGARLGKGVLVTGVLAALVLGWLLWVPRPAVPPELPTPAPEVTAPADQPPAAADAPSPAEPPGEPVPAATAVAADAPAAPLTPSAQEPPVQEPAPISAPPPASQVGVLRLQATGPGQLELTIDGRPAQRYTLQANTILSWKVRRTARIYLENPGSVRLWLEGREIDPAGRNQLVLQPGEESPR